MMSFNVPYEKPHKHKLFQVLGDKRTRGTLNFYLYAKTIKIVYFKEQQR